MRLLEKSKELTKWLLILLCLLGALFFVNGKRVEEYNQRMEVAHRELTYKPSDKYDDYVDSDGIAYKSYFEYAFLCDYFPKWFFLTLVTGGAVAYTGFRTYKEYKKVSKFISEQAALEEKQEKE